MYKVIMIILVSALVGCGAETAPTGSDKVTEVPAPVVESPDPINAPTKADSEAQKMYLQRLDDLDRVKVALSKYKALNGRYPKSPGRVGRYSKQGELTENYIDGLVPHFIKQLPVDPRQSKKFAQNYMYRSNGVDYKFIVLGAPAYDMETADQKLVDKKRPNNAYGVWTPGAENW